MAAAFAFSAAAAAACLGVVDVTVIIIGCTTSKISIVAGASRSTAEAVTGPATVAASVAGSAMLAAWTSAGFPGSCLIYFKTETV